MLDKAAAQEEMLRRAKIELEEAKKKELQYAMEISGILISFHLNIIPFAFYISI